MKLHPVPFTRVRVQDSFWAPRQATNRRVSIPHSLDQLEKAGNMRNFDLAAAQARVGYSGPVFMDSDVYKALEAASYSLASHRDPALEARLDTFISRIAAAQMPDGYLNSHYQVNEPDRRWTNLRDNHEIYCAGHLFEAAVAHFAATGKRSLLDVACKLADHIDRTFGPGKRMGYCGHPEAELALVKLSRAANEPRYFALARFMVENRGSHLFATEHATPADQYDGAYWQDDVPIREHRQIKGHAVRAGYLLSACVDVMAETGDAGLAAMVRRVWRNTTERRMYVTGGIGPSAHNEGFTTDYDLPNLTAYQETCASVAMALWSHRLALLYGDSRYADVMERALYNGFLAGVSLDGTRYFYVNPLESTGAHHRAEWFGCACCPPNVTRTLASIGGYAYGVDRGSFTFNLYLAGAVDAEVAGGKLALSVGTDYPWDGAVHIAVKVAPAQTMDLRLRIPGWCAEWRLIVNGRAIVRPRMDRGYAVVSRRWRIGDSVDLQLGMPVRRELAHPSVKDDAGRAVVARGPLVYCLEACDTKGDVGRLALPLEARLTPERRPGLLGGVTALRGEAAEAPEADWSHGLYRTANAAVRTPVTLVPYYAWDNRAPGAMRVWFPVAPPPPSAGGPERRAKVSVSFRNTNSNPEGVNDGVEPSSSTDRGARLLHWWPHEGGEEWVQYEWGQKQALSATRVYWFDDTGTGACRIPASWRVQYLDGSVWRDVRAHGEWAVARDRWCEASFDPVHTTALRLRVQMQPGYAAGAIEWQVTAEPED